MGSYEFGNYICKLREDKGLTQSELGDILGLTNKAVSKWENGSAYPSREVIPLLAVALGVSVEDIYKMMSAEKNVKSKYGNILDLVLCPVLIKFPIFILIISASFLSFIIYGEKPGKTLFLTATALVCVLTFLILTVIFAVIHRIPQISSSPLEIIKWLFALFFLIGGIIFGIIYLTDIHRNFYSALPLCWTVVAALCLSHGLKKGD